MGHFLFSAKFICMGKQKNRLTATKPLSDPARNPAVCPSADHVVAVVNCLLAPPAVPAAPFQGTFFLPFQGTCAHPPDFAPPYPGRYGAYGGGPYCSATAAMGSISLACPPGRGR